MSHNSKISEAVKMALDAAYYAKDPAGTIQNYLDGLRKHPDWTSDEVATVETEILNRAIRSGQRGGTALE